MGSFSLTHLLLLALIMLIFFGPSRLPALGQSLGKAIRGFKQGLNEIDADATDVTNNQPMPPQNQYIQQQAQQPQQLNAQYPQYNQQQTAPQQANYQGQYQQQQPQYVPQQQAPYAGQQQGYAQQPQQQAPYNPQQPNTQPENRA